MNRLILVLLLFTINCWAYETRYDNYKVYRIIPETKEQLGNIRHLETSGLSLDFWSEALATNVPVDIMVPPQNEDQFHEILLNLKLKADVNIENVQRLIDDEENIQRSRIGSKYGWTRYYNISAINQWLDDIVSSHSRHAKIITVGHSYQGRAIKGVKVSFKKGNKAVFIEGGIHAREWIAPATVTYILNELLTNKTAQIKKIARSYDWYIVPSINPDGYEYSFNVNRYWRKTRLPHGTCVGTDGNRNWDFHWNETSTGLCDTFYGGPAPFSEPEVKSVSEYISSVAKKLVVYLSFHNYRQMLLIPYGTGEHVENYSELLEIGQKVIASLEKRHGTKFWTGNWAENMYPSSGVSVDWVKSVHKVPITYTYELRDTGKQGFVLPPDQIIPVGEEVMDSLVTLIQEVKARGY